MRKYELTNESINWFGRILYRIRALRDFGNVKAGDLGGYIESEKNLSHEGDCWIYGNAKVYENAMVYGDAMVCGYAMVYGDAMVYRNAKVYENAEVYGDAMVYRNAKVYENAEVYGDAMVCGYAMVYENAEVYGYAMVCGNAKVYGYANVNGDTKISCNAEIFRNNHFFNAGPIGSRSDYTTFYRSNDNEILVNCGCFSGNIEEFEKAVKGSHEGTKHERTYKLAIELAKVQIEL